MKRKWIIAVVVLLAAGIATPTLLAAGKGSGRHEPGKWAMEEHHRAAGGMFRQLDLSDQQRQAVREIMEAARQQARGVEDPQQRREIMHEAFGKIKQDVLTDPQREKLQESWKRYRRGGREWKARHPLAGVHLFRQLDLTDQQREAAKEIMATARQQAQGVEDPQQRREIIRQAFAKIKQDVLTDQQREKLEKIWTCRAEAWRRQGGRHGRWPGVLRALDLTQQQREAIGQIMKEARQKILNEVLTEEQRQKLEELREKGQGGKARPEG